jgi:hypothetical protein
MRKFYVLGMIAAACLGVAAQAWAGTDVGSLLGGGPNFFQGGVNREYLIDRNCHTPCLAQGTSGAVAPFKGQIDVGDSFSLSGFVLFQSCQALLRDRDSTAR